MKRLLVLLLVGGCASLAHADEGMWTYNDFPAARVQQAYGFTPSATWLDRARMASVRLAGGCSGSIVSPTGLVMTNHHCAHSCIEQLSTAKRDYVATGFLAKVPADEVRCPEIEINQLQKITDVTARVQQATVGLTGEKFASAQKAAFAEISKACATSDQLRCDVVTLYRGARYDLYQYRRFQDVRLVFAPEFAIAFFGGDPDNFEFPRYDLDVSFLRIYDQGKPAKLDTYFAWSPEGPKEGQLQFVSGHPGSTARLETVAELEFERDHQLPLRQLWLAEYRGMLAEFAARGPEQARIANGRLFGVENSLKVYNGLLGALREPSLLEKKRAEEQSLRKHLAANPKLASVGSPWDEISQAVAKERNFYTRLMYLEGTGRGPMGIDSLLFEQAQLLLRGSVETTKPNGARLEEFAESNLPALLQELGSTAPIYDELEIERLTFSLTKLREALGPDDQTLKSILGKQSPRQLATELVHGSAALKDPKQRLPLWKGGKAAVDAAKIPMLDFARRVDPEARAVRARWENEVKSVTERNHEKIARAQFAVSGTSAYPDATFTLRLSYGAVKGWTRADGVAIKPFTTFDGAFSRATGAEPFKLPDSWLAAKGKLTLATPFDFVTDNDIVGGNSGSPVFDKELRITGLIFDGNIESLGGDFLFDDAHNRAVAVDSAALLEALSKVYGASRVVDEIRTAPAPRG
jgi:hypothetical protein